jgi:hypothetical protein
MSAYPDGNSVVIIGVGLVGSAVLNELVLRWVRGHGARTAGTSVERLPEIEVIYITARSEAKLIEQLRRMRDILCPAEGVVVEQHGPLQLGLRCGAHRLRVAAETLDILPQHLGPATADSEQFRKASSLYLYLARRRPGTLIIGANLAGMIAYAEQPEAVQNLVLAWIFATLKQVVDECGIGTVAVIGTTALGGMGTNMVWTHQSSQRMDAHLVRKILAAYGILGILDRIHWDKDSAARWILLTPGSLLGYDYLTIGPVSYSTVPEGLPAEVERLVTGNALRIPLFAPLEVDLALLSEEEICWEARRLGDAFLTGAQIKCGESGVYSPLQFACISHALQMGFNTNAYIAKILIEEWTGKPTGYNQIPLGSGKVIEPTAQGQNERDLALRRLLALEHESGSRSPPVYPALGSSRTQKEIVLADLLYRLLTQRFGEPTLQQIASYHPQRLAEDLWVYLQDHPRLLAEIVAVIPIISPDGRVHVGPYLICLGRGITRTSDMQMLTHGESFQEFAVLRAVDLRPCREQIVRQQRTYETGVTVLVDRAQFLVGSVEALPYAVIDQCGGALDPRIRHWKMLTADSKTVFDPVLFVVQFLGGERPHQ